MSLGMRVFSGTGVPQDWLRLPAEHGAFGWSSGAFAALASDESTLFLYEPPFGMNRDASLRQRLEFLRLLMWTPFSATRSRAAFWRMVSQRRQGPSGFELAPASLQSRLCAVRGPLLEPHATGLEVRPRAAAIHVAMGGESAPPMERAIARLRAEVPLATFTVLAGCDHLAPLLAPETIATWIRERSGNSILVS